ncbi:MAG TPA: 4-alpha-glucanotransferase [Ignavibacteriaceae bacterium]|nr:4-alpha-glucanotransferase [Ignavibacteriaceae bacterium]
MTFERNAGILLHPTSLPGKYGIGDLGPEAFNFVNFLEHSGQRLWQVLPLGPTGYGDSPYQCFSAFAGNPLLISPDKLLDYGFLAETDISNIPESNPHQIDYGSVINFKNELFLKAFNNFRKNNNGLQKDFERFVKNNSDWLEDYSLFMALKDFHSGAPWNKWEKNLVARESGAMKKWKEKLSAEILYQKFVQYIFFKQWKELKKYANERGIKIIGDVPIFIAYDSAELWANKELFTVDKEGGLEFVAGVPPDYFSATGQLWGNPLYKWNEMGKNDFAWWRKRVSSLLEFIDIIRIDHFRGFDAYWEIPGNSPNAIEGRWVKAPGEKLFNSIKKHFGDLPIIAEDLGVITKSVEALRDQFNIPGMKILQFAFGTGMENKFLPHNYIPNCCVYTGSHDNDTTRAYFEKAKGQDNDILDHAKKYLNYYGENLTSELIRTAYASVANIVLIPMQDMLNLGGEARMNFPSKPGGNWGWRFTWEQVRTDLADYYKSLADLYERPPKEKQETTIVTESN